MAKPKKSGLGRGLDTLIPDSLGIEENESVADTMLKLSEVEPNKSQPRRDFDEEALQALTDSIAEHGIVTPILVQKRDGYYEIIAGERRWRAAKKLGLKEIPACIKEYSEKEFYEVSLLENLQRENLNPIEEALAYKKLMDEFGSTQEEVAKSVSKSRTAITNMLRLLKLSEDVQAMVAGKKISYGHARALIGITDKKKQLELAKKVAEQELSVRDTEKLVKQINEAKKKPEKGVKKKSDIYKDIENKLTEKMGTKTIINEKKPGKGKLEIEYYSAEELERLYDLIMSITE